VPSQAEVLEALTAQYQAAMRQATASTTALGKRLASTYRHDEDELMAQLLLASGGAVIRLHRRMSRSRLRELVRSWGGYAVVLGHGARARRLVTRLAAEADTDVVDFHWPANDKEFSMHAAIARPSRTPTGPGRKSGDHGSRVRRSPDRLPLP
jgi:hypothetical protein